VDDWTGQPAIIVGSGPSAATLPLAQARGSARFIAVNESWKLAPWADILFATDGKWWTDNKGVPDFAGVKMTSSPYAREKFGIKLFASHGSTSGWRAINLAEMLHANPIVLVGFEHHARNGAHWHEPHTERNPGKPEMNMWLIEAQRLGPKFAERGTRVINCTPGSALKCFPIIPFAEWMNGGHGAH